MRDDSRQGGLHPVNDVYHTIMGTGEGGCREKGSRFLGFAFHIREEGEAEAHLAAMAEKYHDARHHCYAWRLGPDGMRYRASDAGEPRHSAGDPILNEIKRRQLYDVLVVVVRYFGGTKLGIPGLMEAYGSAASAALDAAVKGIRTLTAPVHIRFAYGQTSEVGQVAQKFGLKPSHSDYGSDCQQTFDVRLRDHPEVVAVFHKMGILAQD